MFASAPDWSYLESILAGTPYAGRHTECMYVGRRDGYVLYKHAVTRRYVNTDGEECAVYRDGVYVPTDTATQLSQAFA